MSHPPSQSISASPAPIHMHWLGIINFPLKAIPYVNIFATQNMKVFNCKCLLCSIIVVFSIIYSYPSVSSQANPSPRQSNSKIPLPLDATVTAVVQVSELVITIGIANVSSYVLLTNDVYFLLVSVPKKKRNFLAYVSLFK